MDLMRVTLPLVDKRFAFQLCSLLCNLSITDWKKPSIDLNCPVGSPNTCWDDDQLLQDFDGKVPKISDENSYLPLYMISHN